MREFHNVGNIAVRKHFLLYLVLSLILTQMFSTTAFGQTGPVDPTINKTIIDHGILGQAVKVGTINLTKLNSMNIHTILNHTMVVPYLTKDPTLYSEIKTKLDSGQHQNITIVPNTLFKNIKKENITGNDLVTINPGGFTALIENTAGGDWAPPDPTIGVGPNHILQTVNNAMEIWTKNNLQSVKLIDLYTFFSVSTNDYISDPKTLYDSISGKWFVSIFDQTTNSVRVNVSYSNDPTGNWYLYNISTSPYHPDQPKISVNDDKFVITTDLYYGSFVGSKYFVVDKNQMMNGNSSPNMQTFGPYSNHSAILPAKSLSSTSTLYMVSIDGNGATSVTFYSITGSVPNAIVQTSNIGMQTSSYPPSAVQQGTSLTLDTGDNRVQDASWYQGNLWVSFNDACTPSGDGNNVRSCIHLLEINTSSQLLVQDFRVATAGYYYFYPALTIDNVGDMNLIFGYSSSSTYPSIAVTGQARFDSQNTVEQIQNLISGTASALTTNNGPHPRYGDYFGAQIDPSSPLTAWVAGEYIPVPPPDYNTRWSTFISGMSVTNPCTVPSTGNWTVTSSCTLVSSATAPANVIVQPNSVLMIPNGVTLTIHFGSYHLLVNPSGQVYIQPNGKLSS